MSGMNEGLILLVMLLIALALAGSMIRYLDHRIDARARAERKLLRQLVAKQRPSFWKRLRARLSLTTRPPWFE